MTDPNLFGRIDRVLHECDASTLPPLRPAQLEVTDADGTTTRFQALARFNATEQRAELAAAGDTEPDPAIVGLHMDTSRFDRAITRLARWLRGHP